MKYFLFLFLLIGTADASGQRVINRLLYKFPADAKVEEITSKGIKRFVIETNSYINISTKTEDTTSSNRLPTFALSFFKPGRTDINRADSLLHIKIREALRHTDSVGYFKSGMYTWPRSDQPGSVSEYLKQMESSYATGVQRVKKLIGRSSRYYLGYINRNGDKKILVLFDPKKIKWKGMALQVMEPVTVNLSTAKVYFTMPSPDYFED